MRIGLLTALTMIIFLCGAGPEPRGRVALCGDLWCPYNCAPGSDRPGFAIEIAQRVFKAAGYDVDYHVSNWPRCIEDARLGREDGIIAAIPADAPDFVFPHEPIGSSSDGFAVRRGSPFRYHGPQSLDGVVLGLVANYAWGGDIGAYIRAHEADRNRLQFVSGDGGLAKNLAKLDAGHLDVVLDDANVLRQALADPAMDGRFEMFEDGYSVPVFVAFPPSGAKARHYADLLDAGIARLRASGDLSAILRRYHANAW